MIYLNTTKLLTEKGDEGSGGWEKGERGLISRTARDIGCG